MGRVMTRIFLWRNDQSFLKGDPRYFKNTTFWWNSRPLFLFSRGEWLVAENRGEMHLGFMGLLGFGDTVDGRNTFAPL